jgi:DUF4097 and DUF4098 domain-containing protein YvlB
MIIINGKSFNHKGGSISVCGGRVIIDGKDVTGLDSFSEKEINIAVEGGCTEVSTETGNITVNGNVAKSVKSTNGNIYISGDVGGDVKTTNGNVDCGNVNGDIDTVNGDIKHKRQ